MRVKQVCIFLLVLACCSLLAAQDSSQINVQGSGTAGRIPLWTSSHKIGNSIASQKGGRIRVAGGVSVTNHSGSKSENTVFGSNESTIGLPAGSGLYGQLSTSGQSTSGQAWANGGAGTWGDGGADSNYGVVATADDKAGLIANTNGPDYYTIFGFNFDTGAFPFASFNGAGFGCSIDPSGNLSCTGSKNAVVPVDKGKSHVALAAIESPKNWFEDFGSAQLRGGVAVIKLDSRFTQTINTKREYHVFLTPNGECKGLYVHQKDASSFEVRELGGGNSNVTFDYRIAALRKNYEDVRFANHPEFSSIRKDGRVMPPKN